MGEYFPDDEERGYGTADGSLTWWEAEDLLRVRQSPEFEEQRRIDAEVRLIRMEQHWKFLRYLFEHGTFDDDQILRSEGKYDE